MTYRPLAALSMDTETSGGAVLWQLAVLPAWAWSSVGWGVVVVVVLCCGRDEPN
jgi:hypothetical protein